MVTLYTSHNLAQSSAIFEVGMACAEATVTIAVAKMQCKNVACKDVVLAHSPLQLDRQITAVKWFAAQTVRAQWCEQLWN